MLLSLKARPEPSPAQKMVLLVLSLVLTLRARENVPSASGKEDLPLPLADFGDLLDIDMLAKES